MLSIVLDQSKSMCASKMRLKTTTATFFLEAVSFSQEMNQKPYQPIDAFKNSNYGKSMHDKHMLIGSHDVLTSAI